jgi:aromatic ring-opening dioxygenase catalytic subunit (LigB family)
MALDPQARADALRQWSSAPAARLAHPREEHLIPLMVATGAADQDAARLAYNRTFAGLRLSAFHFGES